MSSLFAGGAAMALVPGLKIAEAAPSSDPAPNPKSIDRLLDELERRACIYFQEAADPKTGLILDRMRVKGRETRTVASIAATGFGLSAMCIADQRVYIKRPAAK